jgi:hypothetical protein
LKAIAGSRARDLGLFRRARDLAIVILDAAIKRGYFNDCDALAVFIKREIVADRVISKPVPESPLISKLLYS